MNPGNKLIILARMYRRLDGSEIAVLIRNARGGSAWLPPSWMDEFCCVGPDGRFYMNEP